MATFGKHVQTNLNFKDCENYSVVHKPFETQLSGWTHDLINRMNFLQATLNISWQLIVDSQQVLTMTVGYFPSSSSSLSLSLPSSSLSLSHICLLYGCHQWFIKSWGYKYRYQVHCRGRCSHIYPYSTCIFGEGAMVYWIMRSEKGQLELCS